MVPVVERLLRGIDELSKLIDECDEKIEQVAESDPDIKLLRTVPGVGPLCAAAFVHVIRDPGRFKSSRLVAAYLGLVPSLYESGQTSIKGGITKHGNCQLRSLLHICATALMRTKRDTALKRWAVALSTRIGRKKAKSAIAHRQDSALQVSRTRLRSSHFCATSLPRHPTFRRFLPEGRGSKRLTPAGPNRRRSLRKPAQGRVAPRFFLNELRAVSRLLLTHPGSVKEAPIQCEVGGWVDINLGKIGVSRIEQKVQLVRDDCARHGKDDRIACFDPLIAKSLQRHRRWFALPVLR